MRGMRAFQVVALIAGMMLTAGCVSSSKYRMLEENAASEKSRLERDLSNSNAQLAVLKEEAADLNDRIQGLEERVTLSEQEKSEKEQEIARLTGTYEELVEDLKGEIEKGEIKVTQIRNKLKVNLVEKVLFNSGRAEVNQKGRDILKKVGGILKEVEGKEIRIEGYTDNVPIGGALKERFPSNWELSAQRATTVLRFLQDETGVDGSRLSGVGFGEFRPMATNDTPEGRAENRRIEIVLIPMDIKDVLEDIQ